MKRLDLVRPNGGRGYISLSLYAPQAHHHAITIVHKIHPELDSLCLILPSNLLEAMKAHPLILGRLVSLY